METQRSSRLVTSAGTEAAKRTLNVRASVPAWAMEEAGEKVHGLDIAPYPGSIILTALGKLLGLPDEVIRVFANPRPGPNKRAAASSDEYIRTLRDEGLVS